jgi:hypothetical protein
MAGLFYVWAKRDLDWTGPTSPAAATDIASSARAPVANEFSDAAAVESPASSGPVGREEALVARR